MKCIIIGKLVSCLLSSPTGKDAVEAAKILQKAISPYVYVAPSDQRGPKVIFLYGDPSSGPYGSFGSYPVQRDLNCCSLYIHPGTFNGHGHPFVYGPQPSR